MAKGTIAVSKKKTNKTMNSPSSIHHPPYFEMITEAISTLKERNGSSQPAIAKFIEDKYETALPPNFKKLLSVQLKKLVKTNRLVKIKNSYKISSPNDKLKLAIKVSPKEKIARKISERTGKKTAKIKRLSQVKTPDVLKKANKDGKSAKMKRLSQVKTPDGLKKKHYTKVKSTRR